MRRRILSGLCAVGLLALAPAASAHEPSAGEIYREQSAQLLALQKAKGSASALDELGRRTRTIKGLSGSCHAIAHELGHQALAMAKGKASVALLDRDDVCGGGYTHGIIEKALGSSKDPARDLLRICAPRNDGSCFHGVGHGVMFATDMNLDKSMALCDRAPTPVLRARCGEGIFMQLFSSDDSGGANDNGQTPATARSTCAKTRMPYAANCWFYSPTLWLWEHPDDFTGALTWCMGAPSDFGRTVCVRGLGSRTIKYHPEDPRIGARVCAKAGAYVNSCLAGMGSYWSVHHEGRVSPSDVCSRLGNPALSVRCRTAV